MSKLSLMFSVLKMMYEDQSLDITHLMGSPSPFYTGGPLRLIHTFVPTHYFSLSNLNLAFQNFNPTKLFRIDSQPLIAMFRSLAAYEAYTLFASVSCSVSA